MIEDDADCSSTY